MNGDVQKFYRCYAQAFQMKKSGSFEDEEYHIRIEETEVWNRDFKGFCYPHEGYNWDGRDTTSISQSFV